MSPLLPVLPGPAEVASHDALLRCPHLHATLYASSCLARHAARTGWRGAASQSPTPTYPGCARCPDGRALAQRLGASSATPGVAGPCAVPGCTDPPGALRGTTLPAALRRLCRRHRALAQVLRRTSPSPDDAVQALLARAVGP